MAGLVRSLAFAAALASVPAAAAPLRQPIKGWVLDYGDTACTALRTYGSEAAPLTLAFRPSPNGTVVRLVVARLGRAPAPYHFPVTTNIPSGRVRTTALRFGGKDKKTQTIWINFERSALEGLSRAGEIAIRGGGAIDERFALPGIAAVLKGLDECNADLRKYWNVGGAGVPIAAHAQPLKPLAAYFSDRDYPAQAIDEHASGRTGLMMMVDEAGVMRDCLVEQTSGIATLDAMACLALRQRAKFKPALDPAGKPVRSVLTGAIVWRMP
jgi:hypothetical protein